MESILPTDFCKLSKINSIKGNVASIWRNFLKMTHAPHAKERSVHANSEAVA